MNTISIPAILALPVAERIRLAELIWDSVANTPEVATLPQVQETDLLARLREFEAEPEAGYTWEQVRAHIKNKTCHTA